MAKVAFLGLGVMGYPMAGHLRPRAATRSRSTTARTAKAEKWVGAVRRHARRHARRGGGGPGFRHGLRRQRRRPARGRARHRRRLRRHEEGRGVRRSHHRLGRDRARASRRGQEAAASTSSTRRCPAARPARRTASLTVMCGGEADPFARARAGDRAPMRKACNLLGPAGSGQLAKMVNQICIAGLVAGSRRGTAFRQARRPRHREAGRDDLQGRGAVLADGEPLQDHDRRQVRLRLRGGLDAQGPRRSASPRRAATARICRSPRWSTSSTPKCRRWAASAGTRRA